MIVIERVQQETLKVELVVFQAQLLLCLLQVTVELRSEAHQL